MRLFPAIAIILSAACVFAQSDDSRSTSAPAEANQDQGRAAKAEPQPAPAAAVDPNASSDNSTQPTLSPAPRSKKQPKRILGIMPNYRAVSAGAIPPPPTAKEAFTIATQNTFDYSSFAFVGITSALSEWTDGHQQLGEGLPGFGRYYWRGFVDKTTGNYLVIFALPTIFHQDERYFAMGQGGFWKRAMYSASRVLITPNYHGHNTFNTSEVLGRAIAQGISMSYYPSQDRNLGSIAVKYGFAIGRDALTNVFREFWPDIAGHFRHHHAPQGDLPGTGNPPPPQEKSLAMAYPEQP